MAHPFFDAPRYPWHRTDARDFHKALYTAIPAIIDISRIYAACDNNNLAPLDTAGGPLAVWQDALQKLATLGSLEGLCRLALERAPMLSADVQVIINASPEPPPPPGHVCLVVDRHKLRTALGQMQPDNATTSVLLVRGAPGCGASWTQQLVTVFAAGAPVTYLFEGQVFSVEDVLAQLFAFLGKPQHVEPRLETEQAWYRKICNSMQAFAQELGTIHWIVIDDLDDYRDGPRVDPEVRRFCDQLVLMMANPALARWFRVVLLGYPDGILPTRWKKQVLIEDRPDPSEIDAANVARFVLEWASGARKALSPEKAQEIATHVITRADAAQGRDRLQTVHDHIKQAIEAL
ncbi:MAG: hypothetical protein V4475_12060 [Pseudomonadota bacterium]